MEAVHMVTTTGNLMLSHALEYAEKGWAVFPLCPNTKRPQTTNGYKDATTDVTTISNWWERTPSLKAERKRTVLSLSGH